MTNKVSYTSITNLNQQSSTIAALNNNFAAFQTAMNNTLSRDGTATNTMGATLDMNSNRIINLPAAITDTEPVRKSEFDDWINFASSGTVPNGGWTVPEGGTGTVTLTSNGVLLGNGTGAISAVSPGTAGYSLIANGASSAPSFQGFLQTGTGAITRTWNAKSSDTYNAADFGVTGDGTTDDAPNINKAIDAVKNAGGGILRFNKGTFLLTSTNMDLESNVFIQGSGVDVTVIKNGAATNMNGFAKGIHNLGFQDLTVDGSAMNTSTSMLELLGGSLGNNHDILVNRVKFAHMPSGGSSYAINVSDTTFVTITNCIFSKDTAQATGINEAIAAFGSRPAYYLTFSNNVLIKTAVQGSFYYSKFNYNDISSFIYGSGLVFAASSSNYNEAIGNYIHDSTGPDSDGVYSSGMEILSGTHRIIGNHIARCSANGLALCLQNGIVANNVLIDNGQNVPGGGNGIGVYSYPSASITLPPTNNTFQGNTAYDTGGGKQVYGYAEIIVSGGSGPAIDGNTLSGNQFSGNATGAFSLAAGSTTRVEPTPVGVGTTGQVLVSTGTGTLPLWTTVGTTGITASAVTYAKIQNVSATSRILGRITSGAGVIEELTGTQTTTLLDVFTSGLKGLTPSSGGGTTNFLRADGTWAAPPGGVGTGDVVGPGSATDNAIARFDTTTGKLIQNSAVTIADTTGVIAGSQGITFTGTSSGTIGLVPPAAAGANTLTLPIATDTLVGKATTDTLTNKTLTSPTLTTPVLGTPSSGTLTSCTGLPISGLTASTVTALGVGSIELGAASDTTIARVSAGKISVEGVNVVTISSTDTLTNKTLTSPTLTTPVLGTPSSGTLTSCTGLPATGLVADTTTALGIGTIELGHASDTTLSRASAGKLNVEGVNVVTISSTDTLTNKTYDTAGTGNAFSINSVAANANTGTGAVARATSPTFVTPTLGAATATTINKVTITAPASSAALTLTDGKTLAVNNTLTLAGTDSTTQTFPTVSSTIAAVTDVQLFTGSGTWTKPSGTPKYIHVELVGAGGGGGGGARTASGILNSGGGGGGGAQSWTDVWYAAGDLSATETVTIGAGGTGGAGATVDGTAGSNGVAGGTTTFGATRVFATGGGFGAGGQVAGGSGGGGGGGSLFTGGNGSTGTGGGGGIVGGTAGGSGANGSTGTGQGGTGGGGGISGAAGGGAGQNVFGCTGGGAGGGVTVTPAGTAGGSAGSSHGNFSVAVGLVGLGGGGGASNAAGVGTAGSAGANYGGGGGGGGGAVGGNGGAGGNGAGGAIRVTTFY